MNVAYFTHSLVSCWNHGNAHFVRGLASALVRHGHRVLAFEPENGWSRANLVAEFGGTPLQRFAARFPGLDWQSYGPQPDLDRLLGDADLVIVHEWTDPGIVAAIGARRRRTGRFLLLFHDTHHRAVSDPAALRRLDLSGYDAVLAFGESVARVYRSWGWGDRVFVFHEGADTSRFAPPAEEGRRAGLAWIGNWGDEERSREIADYLLRPAGALRLPLDVYGVRYPAAAIALLEAHGARYRGWLANADVPAVYARHLATVHVPRRFYAEQLPGIPTIRVFEALACGIPLACAPWQDSEGLFRPGTDYLLARTPGEMRAHLRALRCDPALRASLAANGLETIRRRHTCEHRATELMGIVSWLARGSARGAA